MKALKVIPVMLALAAGWSCANAAADFVTIKRTQSNLSDAVPQLLVTFTLPSTLNRSSSTSNSAVLDLEALGSEFNNNEVYVNPPANPICGDNATDAYQSESIGTLQEHDDDNLKTEWAANHIAFSSALLETGSNTLMICIRNINGEAGPGAGNLDDISVRSLVLHYHTTQ
jgi:hypothetical protein